LYKNNSGLIVKAKVSKNKKGLCLTEKLAPKNPLLFLYINVASNLIKIVKSLYFLLLISIFTSCATLKSDKYVNGQIELTKENLNLLNGKYTRNPINQSEKWKGDLFWNFYTRGYNVGADSICAVELKIVDEKHLNVTLLKNDSIVKSKTLKGKIKDGYFEMRQRKFIVPAVFLNIFRTTKFRIGLLENKNLTTDYKQIAWGTGFVIIPFFDKEREPDFEYKKIN